MMMDYLIVYRDRTEFSNEDAPPEWAPPSNVMAVFQRDDLVGWREEPSPEGYWVHKDGEWFGTDQAGFWSYVLTYHGPKAMLVGEVIPDAEWKTKMRPYLNTRFGVLKTSEHARESA